jgi:hypothetical protein
VHDPGVRGLAEGLHLCDRVTKSRRIIGDVVLLGDSRCVQDAGLIDARAVALDGLVFQFVEDASISITGDIYGHTSDHTARAAVDGWSGALGL